MDCVLVAPDWPSVALLDDLPGATVSQEVYVVTYKWNASSRPDSIRSLFVVVGLMSLALFFHGSFCA